MSSNLPEAVRMDLRVAANLILKAASNVNDEVWGRTPERFANSWEELLEGYSREEELREILTSFESEGSQQLVVMCNIPFYSVCEHHLLPFFGHASVGYIPDKHILGASKLARLVDIYSKRLQLQERITTQIADALEKFVEPSGVAVVLEGEHLCMAMRGIQKVGSKFVTSEMRGAFRNEPETRAEFLSLCRRSTI